MRHGGQEIEDDEHPSFVSKVEGPRDCVREVVKREDSQLSNAEQAQFLKDL